MRRLTLGKTDPYEPLGARNPLPRSRPSAFPAARDHVIPELRREKLRSLRDWPYPHFITSRSEASAKLILAGKLGSLNSAVHSAHRFECEAKFPSLARDREGRAVVPFTEQ